MQIFACGLLGLLSLLILAHTLSHLLHISRERRSAVYGKLLRHLLYPRLFTNHHSANPTKAAALLYITHWIGTGFCNAWGIRTTSEAGLRAGSIAIIHLIPLLMAPQLSFASDVLGVPLATYERLHRSLGLMAAVQGIFHGLVAIGSTARHGTVWATSLTVSTSNRRPGGD